jgi:hypothetical protein
MLTRIRSRLTYANVMATIAVFLALGGVTVAALPKKSVGTKQLKNKSVSTKKLKNKAVTSKKLGNKAVRTGKIAGSAVTSSKIAANAVDTEDIANEAVTRAKVSDGAIPFLGTLRSGQELRGVFDIGGDADAPGDGVHGAVSLQFPLENPPATPPQANIIDMTVLAPPTTANCGGLSGGNEQTPLAAPGQICVYITGSNANFGTLTFNSAALTRLGFGLRAEALLAGEVQVNGQWAVTAP